MRIAYLFHVNDHNLGVFRKISSQLSAWENLGNDVAAFHITASPIAREKWTSFRYRSAIQGTASRMRAWADAATAISTWKPDLVYFRYDVYFPSLWRLFAEHRTVVEINTDDLKEYSLNWGLRSMYNHATRGLILGRASGIVYVSGELSTSPCFSKYGKAGLVIGNSIDLSQYAVLPPPASTTPRLVFIGSPGQVWHGVDKVVTLARRFPAWHFDIIGSNDDTLAAEGLSNLQFHGYLQRGHYEKILANADVAIGTLALHRNGMNEASPLKVREYMAFGIPTIIGYHDTDFPTGAPFLLTLPNFDGNIEDFLDSIEHFVYSWMGRRLLRSSVRHLDVSVKEAQRLEFMARVVEDA